MHKTTNIVFLNMVLLIPGMNTRKQVKTTQTLKSQPFRNTMFGIQCSLVESLPGPQTRR